MTRSPHEVLVGTSVFLWLFCALAVADARAAEPAGPAADVDLLALVIWHEARGESAEAKSMVAAVVLERVRDARWPDSIQGVLSQRSQFRGLNLSWRPAASTPGWSDCIRIAAQALAAGPAESANHFHNVDVTPRWHDPSRVVRRVGRHVFLRL